MKRLLITGSRDWTSQAIIVMRLGEALGELSTQLRAEGFEDWRAHEHYTLVSGNARGVDRMCEEVWEAWKLPVERHPARWDVYGKRAGYVRNADMVALGADLCLAFLMPCSKPEHVEQEKHPSHGGDMCATLAEQAGIPTRRYTP